MLKSTIRRVLENACVIGMKLVDLNPYTRQPLHGCQVNNIKSFEAPSPGDGVAHQMSSKLTYAIVILDRNHNVRVRPE